MVAMEKVRQPLTYECLSETKVKSGVAYGTSYDKGWLAHVGTLSSLLAASSLFVLSWYRYGVVNPPWHMFSIAIVFLCTL
jgi:hypothetical protein